MNSIRAVMKHSFRSFLALVLLATSAATFGQQLSQQNQTLINAAKEIIATARYAALITITSNGKAEARTMDPLPPDEDLVIWFGTNPASQKVKEIRRNSHVTIYYLDAPSQAYVSIQGAARVVSDPKEKLRHWKEEWSAFYPDREKGFVLIAVTPTKMEVVNVAKGIVGDANTWKPATVIFPPQRKRR